MDKKKNINKDRILGIIMLALAAFFAFFTTKIQAANIQGDPGPKLFPYLGCAVVAICALVLIFKKNKEQYKPYMSKEQWKRFWTVFGIYVLNYILMYIGGYLLSVPVTLFLSCLLFSKGSGVPLWKKIVYPIVVTAGFFLVYVVLLKSALPYGILMWRIII